MNIAPLPEDLRSDPALLCGCVSGAISAERTEKLLREAGFVDVAIAVNQRAATRSLHGRRAAASRSAWHPRWSRPASRCVHDTGPGEALVNLARPRPASPEDRLMSEFAATAGDASAGKPAMSVFERFLTFWVALCIIAGIALGQLLPGVFHAHR